MKSFLRMLYLFGKFYEKALEGLSIYLKKPIFDISEKNSYTDFFGKKTFEAYKNKTTSLILLYRKWREMGNFQLMHKQSSLSNIHIYYKFVVNALSNIYDGAFLQN